MPLKWLIVSPFVNQEEVSTQIHSHRYVKHLSCLFLSSPCYFERGHTRVCKYQKSFPPPNKVPLFPSLDRSPLSISLWMINAPIAVPKSLSERCVAHLSARFRSSMDVCRTQNVIAAICRSFDIVTAFYCLSSCGQCSFQRGRLGKLTIKWTVVWREYCGVKCRDSESSSCCVCEEVG